MTDRLVIPGLVNAHTHAHGALGRGAVADVALEGLLVAEILRPGIGAFCCGIAGTPRALLMAQRRMSP